jgi:hypothetical protein
MANRERIESAGESPPPQPTSSETKSESELPLFTSPPLSPAGDAPAPDVVPPPIEVVEMPEPPRAGFKMPKLKMPQLPRFNFNSFKMSELPHLKVPQFKVPHVALPRFDIKLTRRRKRHAVLAATVMLAAGLGAVIGAAASGGFTRQASQVAPQNVADVKERQATQQIIARLTKDIGALKASVAASKTAHTHVAKISDKTIDKPAAKPAEKIARAAETSASPEITGSIPTVTPLPLPRPVEAESLARPPVVKDWSIRNVRDGYVYVQGRGDIYEVVPGAPLPGIGPVQSIKRQDGRWVVTTPKGLIVSQRDRKFFE